MFNPVTGQRVFYKNVIDFLVSLHREDALTCTGYDDKISQQVVMITITSQPINMTGRQKLS